MEQSADKTQKAAAIKSDTWINKTKENLLRFAEETSLHGAKCVIDKRRRKAMRVFWFFAVALMLGNLVSALYDMCEDYWSFPFKTHITSAHYKELSLPSISLCMRHSLQRSRLRQSFQHADIIEEAIMSLYDQKLGQNATVREVLHNVTLIDLMNAGSFRQDEVIKDVHVGQIEVYSNPRQFTFITWDGIMDDSGYPVRCFIFNNTKGNDGYVSLNRLDKWVAILQVPTTDLLQFDDIGGVFVSVGESSEVPSSYQTINMLPGSAVEIVLTKSQNRFLPAPYRSLNNEDCEDTEAPGYKSPLKLMRRYSFFNCLHETAVMTWLKECNCTVLPLDADGVFSKTPLCTLLKYFTCAIERVKDVISTTTSVCKNTCVQDIITRRSSAVIPYPAVNYTRSFPNATGSEKNLLKLTVKFDTTQVMITEHTAALTLMDICGILGGRMGLFVGASLLTFTELAEYILFTMFGSLWYWLKHLKGKIRDDRSL